MGILAQFRETRKAGTDLLLFWSLAVKAGRLLLQHRSEHKSDIGMYAPHCAFERVFDKAAYAASPLRDSIRNAPQELLPENLPAFLAFSWRNALWPSF